MGRRFIAGDIHACRDELAGALEKAGFDMDEDVLYSTGDVFDRGVQPLETMELLMGLGDRFRPVLGNHDSFLEESLWNGQPEYGWFGRNGGHITWKAVTEGLDDEGRKRLRHWLGGFPVIRVEEDIIIVHGGLPWECTDRELETLASRRRPVPLSEGSRQSFFAGGDWDWAEEVMWDRSYLKSAMQKSGRRGFSPDALGFLHEELPPLETKRTILVGHTPLLACNGGREPFRSKRYSLIALDTGAGHGGPVTVMDIDSGRFWQS